MDEHEHRWDTYDFTTGARVCIDCYVTELPFGEPLTGPNAGAAPPRRHRHHWVRHEMHVNVAGEAAAPVISTACVSCNAIWDEAASKRGRNARKRGNRQELTVARQVGGTKVGPMGWPWDVVIDGLFRIQVRKYLRPESLRKIAAELSRIANTPGPEAPAYVWVEPGRGGEQLIVMRLRDFTAYTGVRVEGER